MIEKIEPNQSEGSIIDRMKEILAILFYKVTFQNIEVTHQKETNEITALMIGDAVAEAFMLGSRVSVEKNFLRWMAITYKDFKQFYEPIQDEVANRTYECYLEYQKKFTNMSKHEEINGESLVSAKNIRGFLVVDYQYNQQSLNNNFANLNTHFETIAKNDKMGTNLLKIFLQKNPNYYLQKSPLFHDFLHEFMKLKLKKDYDNWLENPKEFAPEYDFPEVVSPKNRKE